MVQYPHVRALLRELLGLSDEEAELPLQLVANMYRGRLRALLPVLAEYVPQPLLNGANDFDRIKAANRILGERYPALIDNRWTREAFEILYWTPLTPGILVEYFTQIDIILGGPDVRWDMTMESDYLFQDFIICAQEDWMAYEPVLALFRLTISSMPFELAANGLELILATHPPVHDVLLDLASQA